MQGQHLLVRKGARGGDHRLGQHLATEDNAGAVVEVLGPEPAPPDHVDVEYVEDLPRIRHACDSTYA